MEARLVRSSDPEIIVHSWREDAASAVNPPVYIPKAYVTKRARGLKVMRSGKTLKSISFRERGHPASIDIVGDLKHDDMRAVAIYALEFEDMLSRTIGGPPRNIPYRVRFFADQKEFAVIARRSGAANAMSYYSPKSGEIVMWFNETMTHSDLQGLLAHEFTHAYMDIVHECTSPLWFAEGMAEYFQHFTWTGDRAEPGAINEAELAHLKRGVPLPIDQFVKLPRDEMYGPDYKLLYAEAWSVVHFLVDHEPGVIQNLLRGRQINVSGMNEEWEENLNAMLKLV